MAAVIPNPDNIRSFPSEKAFETWLRANHAREKEIWLKIYKKGSGLPTVTPAEAIDVALCWGWIDGIRKSFDDVSYLQRFTPRGPKSVWSRINQENVKRLVEAGRMTPHGQKQVDAAKSDGRWEAAYAPVREATPENIPEDLRAAIDASQGARKMFGTLNRMNLFALIFRVNNMKTATGRQRQIARLVTMLERGETISPQAGKKKT